MTRGMGSVYRRKRSPHWWIKFHFEGRVHRESAKTPVKRAAVALLKKRHAEIAGGHFIPKPEYLTFDDLAHMYLEDYRVNGRRSLMNAEYTVRHLRAFFGTRPAIEITTDRVTAYTRTRLDQGAARATVRNELAGLGRMLALAHRAGRLPVLPYVPKPKVDNARQGFFTEDEIQRVLEALPEHARGPVEFAYLTGWRRSEVLSLRWPQVDFKAGTVRLEVGTTKNGDGREFPFSALPRLARLLRRVREETTAFERETQKIVPLVFHYRGRQLDGLRTSWATACRKAGVPGKLFHDFRRTAVRNLERAGVSRSVAMKLTGHKTESIYRRYAIVCQEDLSTGVERLARLVQGEGRNKG